MELHSYIKYNILKIQTGRPSSQNGLRVLLQVLYCRFDGRGLFANTDDKMFAQTLSQRRLSLKHEKLRFSMPEHDWIYVYKGLKCHYFSELYFKISAHKLFDLIKYRHLLFLRTFSLLFEKQFFSSQKTTI